MLKTKKKVYASACAETWLAKPSTVGLVAFLKGEQGYKTAYIYYITNNSNNEEKAKKAKQRNKEQGKKSQSSL